MPLYRSVVLFSVVSFIVDEFCQVEIPVLWTRYGSDDGLIEWHSKTDSDVVHSVWPFKKSSAFNDREALLHAFQLECQSQHVPLNVTHINGFSRVELNRDDVTLRLGRKVARILGWPAEQSFSHARIYDSPCVGVVDQVEPVYMLCDLIEPTSVGCKSAPVLARFTVNYDAKTVCSLSGGPYYFPLDQRHIASVNIRLVDSLLSPLVFSPLAEVRCVLHVRPRT